MGRAESGSKLPDFVLAKIFLRSLIFLCATPHGGGIFVSTLNQTLVRY